MEIEDAVTSQYGQGSAVLDDANGVQNGKDSSSCRAMLYNTDEGVQMGTTVIP